jgi:predicted O-methyltransferase YrrM
MEGPLASPIMDAYVAWEQEARKHDAGTFPNDVLRSIEKLLPRNMKASAETGCGKSTILFSNTSEQHTVFCLDDREAGPASSVRFFQDCPLTRQDRLRLVFGPTQRTLPLHQHTAAYDLVLLDGPHGWPYPELEYYFFYPHVRSGGLLVLDDCNIPTIGRLADILAEEAMWRFEWSVKSTLVFRRTDAELFDPVGDGWWDQGYNRRRVSPKRDIYLAGPPPRDAVTSLGLDERIYDDSADDAIWSDVDIR